MIDITQFYKQAEEYSISGIYIYINNDTKEVFISYSRNILESIYRNIRDNNYRNSEVFILETGTPENKLKINASSWINKYRNNGYKVLNKVIPVKYKIHIELNKDYEVEVILRSRGYISKVLGTFSNMADAIQFAEVQKKEFCS